MNIADINQEARDLVDADTTSYPATTLLRRCNSAYEEIIGDLIALDKIFKFGDTNYSDQPFGTFNLVAGQQDYLYSDTLLAIERVEVKDNSGNWTKLTLLDERKIDDALSEYEKTDGLPAEYAVRANSLFLYPAPAIAQTTLTAGGKIYFRRTADIFTSAEVTTGTKTPGFASPYHILIAYKAALPYARLYKPERVNSFEREIQRLHSKLMAHYNNQNKDKLSRAVPAVHDCR